RRARGTRAARADRRRGSGPGRQRRTREVNGRSASAHASRREGRRLALAAIFEAEFGQTSAMRALERHLAGSEDPEANGHARELVIAVTRHRDQLDALIERAAPAYPVVQLARIDRALLRLALGELLHSATTPRGAAISEWVELARSYSGEPARRLLNGILGRVAAESTGTDRASLRSGGGVKGGS
ncbi:MAG: transcription antitermination factor NusB, partial [Chloroflexota bacterium]|nr:transcription antitermination factor NusB [Chloroflexota bacterium]